MCTYLLEFSLKGFWIEDIQTFEVNYLLYNRFKSKQVLALAYLSTGAWVAPFYGNPVLNQLFFWGFYLNKIL